MKTRVLAIVGPTASGKTALSIELAMRLNGEIISCDSMQLYRGMDIGTAKPTQDEMQGVPHHLIDILEPQETFSVADYVKVAGEAISDIAARGKLPILVGGTGLYLNALLDGIRFEETGSAEHIRAHLKAKALEHGNAYLLERLREIDPETAATLHENNLKRVIRALEIYELTGETMSAHRRRSKAQESIYDSCIIGLTFSNREILYKRINRRVDLMLEQGLLQEAKHFYQLGASTTAAQAIGYKELADYIEGQASLAQCTERLKQETRRYAKRQLTWFRRDTRISWIEMDFFQNVIEIADAAEKIYSKCCKNML